MKKVSAFLAALLLFCSCFGVLAFGADETKTVTVRIEGASDTYYYGTFETTAKTVEDVLTELDANEDEITLTINDHYLSGVNKEYAGAFGGWDGWLYRVNGTEPSVAINEYTVADNDTIVLYYGDPYGVGMQYPTVNTQEIADGILTFTSSDAVYDENWNVSYVTAPVVGATVTWYVGDVKTDYVTDENGQITVDTDLLTAGEHRIQIEKKAENGLPLVLRFAPDETVEVADLQTGDRTVVWIYPVIALIAAVAAKTAVSKKYFHA